MGSVMSVRSGGLLYEGQFIQGKKHGQGKLFFKEVWQFVGEFHPNEDEESSPFERDYHFKGIVYEGGRKVFEGEFQWKGDY